MKLPSPRIRIAQCNNDHARVFHTTTALSITSAMILDFPLKSKQRNNIHALGPFGAWLVLKLATIPGVVQAGMKQYEVGITISPAFTWEEIEDGVIEALKVCFGTEKDKVEVIRN